MSMLPPSSGHTAMASVASPAAWSSGMARSRHEATASEATISAVAHMGAAAAVASTPRTRTTETRKEKMPAAIDAGSGDFASGSTLASHSSASAASPARCETTNGAASTPKDSAR